MTHVTLKPKIHWNFLGDLSWNCSHIVNSLLEVIFKKEKLSDFQREATNESNKNETCEHTI